MSDNCGFEESVPEKQGIPSICLYNFIKELEENGINIHSLLMFRNNKMIFEGYYKPFERETLHRMFSVTKSFVSAGIGILMGKGEIDILRSVIDYFPEYDLREVHPLVRKAAVKDLLSMRSPHDKSAFKQIDDDDYVKSFFCLEPVKVPGTAFSYDTSASHTLCALVEKISGKSLIDFLRDEFLDEIGFSKKAYCLKDPLGRTLGGSGLMARPLDIALFAHVFLNGGKLWNGNRRQVIDRDFVNAAVSKQSDTFVKGTCREERQGYGFQFWRTSKNGYMCYGIGGQFAFVLPDFNFVMVISADTLEMKDSTDRIFESFFRCIYPYFSDICIAVDKKAEKLLAEAKESLEVKYIDFGDSDFSGENIVGKVFDVTENKFGIRDLKVYSDGKEGKILFKSFKGDFELCFGFNKNIGGKFPYYGYEYIASGGFVSENIIIVKCHIIDEEIGTVYFHIEVNERNEGVLLTKTNVGMGFEEFKEVYIIVKELE